MDAETFKTIFMSFRHKLFGIALRLTGNSEDAEDAVQEAYARFWERRVTIAMKDSPEAYCVATLRNICIDIIRRRRDTEPVENAAGVIETDETEEIRDNAAMVIRIMETLPRKQKEVMQLRDLQELQFAEISELLGESEGNIRSLLSRARKKVREAFFKR